MSRTVEMKIVIEALSTSENNIRQREGRSFPPPVSTSPRVYILADVLWWLGGQERTLILQALKMEVQPVRRALSQVVDAPRYILPRGGPTEGQDPLMG